MLPWDRCKFNVSKVDRINGNYNTSIWTGPGLDWRITIAETEILGQSLANQDSESCFGDSVQIKEKQGTRAVGVNVHRRDGGCRIFRFERPKIMPCARSWLLWLVVWAWSGLWLAAQEAEGPLPPRVTSVFPLGGQQGTRVEAEVRGLALDGAYAAWFDDAGLRADIVGLKLSGSCRIF